DRDARLVRLERHGVVQEIRGKQHHRALARPDSADLRCAATVEARLRPPDLEPASAGGIARFGNLRKLAIIDAADIAVVMDVRRELRQMLQYRAVGARAP